MNFDRNLRHRPSRLLLALPAAVLALSLTACVSAGIDASGEAEASKAPQENSSAEASPSPEETAPSTDSGSDRPNAEELAAGIRIILDQAGLGAEYTDTEVACIADAFTTSEVGDQDLRNLADGKDVQTSEAAKQLVAQTMAAAVQSCNAA